MTGKELKSLRESAGLTQTQLAKMCGLSSGNVITNYESDDKKGSRNITKPMEILFKILLGETKISVFNSDGHFESFARGHQTTSLTSGSDELYYSIKFVKEDES